jgi:hypothetical protein
MEDRVKHYSFLINLLLCVNVMNISSRFVTGDGFRNYAHVVFDDTTTFDPYKVKKSDVIFVKTDLLNTFFETMHPYIPEPYVLITHNSDHGISSKFIPYLNSTKLIAWFSENALHHHPKLHPIPIGIANRSQVFGDSALLEKVLDEPPATRDYFLYVNFHTGWGRPHRKDILKSFSSKPFCTIMNRKPFELYLRDLKRSVFVLSPTGSGFDCYRTWEALLCGCYPIVPHSKMDHLFDGLPVVLVHNFNEVTEPFLQKKFIELSAVTQWKWEKLTMTYWINIIENSRNNI